MLVLVCESRKDDFKKTKSGITKCVKKLGMQTTILAYDTLSKMLFALEDIASQVDLIYMDVDELGSLSGNKFAEKLKECACFAEVIFLASCDQRWRDGYDAGALQFLLREECQGKKFEEVFCAATQRISSKGKNAMVFGFAEERAIVPISDIRYFKSEGRIMHVYYQEDQEFEFYSRMTKIEKSLSDLGFVRVHRSYLVNKAFIVKVKGARLTLLGGTELPLNRANASTLRKEVAPGTIMQVHCA